MARRIVALILGLALLGGVTTLLFFSKEAGIEVDQVESDDEQRASLSVRVLVSSEGEIRVDGRPIDPAELTDEVARIVAAAEEASLPVPSFVLAVPADADHLLLYPPMESLALGGAESIEIEWTPVN
ncbi:MAG: hypothetical protein QNI99_15975 [Woeseiaceae bacterium]|nr:hypothetical protein [Woeseiaceae bacterium]